jgi:MFS family permease
MLLSGYAGGLSDRFGPRRFIVVALLCTAFFAGLYPFIASVPWLVGLGLLEGVFTISGLPATMAEVSRRAEPGQFARTQAVFQTVQTGVEIGGALIGGALFTVSPVYAFVSISVVCVLGAVFGFAPRGIVARPARETP